MFPEDKYKSLAISGHSSLFHNATHNAEIPAYFTLLLRIVSKNVEDEKAQN
jgi:hypothetical protein